MPTLAPTPEPTPTIPPVGAKNCGEIPRLAPLEENIPANFSAPFLWADIDFGQSKTLCHNVERIANEEQRSAGAISFSEVGIEAGLNNAIGGGNQHGVGVGFIDIDLDGWQDIFVANGLQDGGNRTQFSSMLYKNNRDGTFTNVTTSSGVAAVLDGKDTFSVASSDFDSDGDLDIAIGTHPNDILLSNNGSGSFTDVSQSAGLNNAPSSSSNRASDGRSKIVSFGDYNSDGQLDLASVSSAFDPSIQENMVLMNNNGDATFTDVSALSGITAANSAANGNTGNPCALLWSDYDNDGFQDIMIWNDRGNSSNNRVLLRNQGNGTFNEVSAAAGIAGAGGDRAVSNPMGIDAADIDHDGDLDFYISNIGRNPLLLNNSNGTFRLDRSSAAGEFGWGLGFEDFNADSWPDIFVTQEDNRDYLVYTHPGTVPVDYGTPTRLAHTNVNNARAHNVGAAFADYDNDGKVDVVTATTDGSRIQLFKNTTDYGTNRWLEVTISNTPVTGEFGGISARIIVKTGDLVQFRDITSGSSRASQNALSVRFGLGQYTGADWVAALWPDGRQMTLLNVAGNQRIDLSEE